MKEIQVKGKTYKLPIYLPDATRAVVKGLSTQDLENVGTRGVVVNTLHLAKTPGSALLEKVHGVKNFMNFDGLVVSDSGGWQIFSLIHRTGRPGKIVDDGVVFYLGRNRKELFTPEDSIKMQFSVGADIMICLDDFTSPSFSEKEIKKSVDRTTLWAKRCKDEFERQLNERKIEKKDTPLLFAVIQGHSFKEFRKASAAGLLEIGFDGYGFGGYAIDDKGNLDLEISEYIANLIPDDKYKFALGTGKPKDIIAQRKFGWDIFDCTLPTRDARHGKLYLDEKESINIDKLVFSDDFDPVSNGCFCETCKNHTRAYLHHLFKVKDIAYNRLSTIHNLYYFNSLLEKLC